jgi:hypothetical protein
MRGALKTLLAVACAIALVLGTSTPAGAYGVWAIPSGHLVGWYIYGTPINTQQWGLVHHTGVDFLTNGDCTGNWDGGHQGTNVYSPTWGTVQYVFWLNPNGTVTTSSGGTGSKEYGLSIYNPGYGKYMYFWHMANNTNTTSYIMSAIAPGLNVVEGTQLGWQGDATGVFDTCVHLHFTVSTNGSGDFLWRDGFTCDCVDPTSYIGPNLNYFSPDHVPANATYPIDYDGDPPSLP